MLAVHLFNQGELGYPIHYRDQSALKVLACHGVNLPVANTGFFGNDGGALVNTDTVSDLAAFILGAIFLFPLLVVLPQMRMQGAAIKLVGPDVLINAFMADQDALLILQLS